MDRTLSEPARTTPHPVESALHKLQDDVTRLNGQVHRSQRLATLGTAAAMMAHEFNNMMTPILGYAKFALNSDDPVLMAKALRTTLKQAEAVSAMADRILGMAVDEPVAFSAVSVRDVVDDAIHALCRDLSKDGITVSVNIDHDVQVWADAKQLRQVFFNLLLNSRDALDGRTGQVTFAARATDNDTVKVTVSDTGCGIPADRLDVVFEAFFTTKTGSNGGKRGTGLGLAICRDIIEEHRGSIRVENRPDQGATFTITLPAAR